MKTLQEKYKTEIEQQLFEHLELENRRQVPKVVKVIINVGLGDASQNAKLLEEALNHVTLITGQKPLVTRAKKSIAGFKVREGMPVGVMVTLRGERMYQFLSKLVNVVLPRIRDFRGIADAGFDGKGNYNLGLKEQLIFPEVEYDMVTRVRGMNISIVTSSATDHESKKLLTLLGFPFTNKDKALVLV
jgi:large subunit ribosomal protein L5